MVVLRILDIQIHMRTRRVVFRKVSLISAWKTVISVG